MIKVTEYQLYRENIYKYEIIENGQVVYTEEIKLRSIQKEINSKKYLMLYDAGLKPITEVFNFLNFYTAKQSINSRIKSLQALKHLVVFEKIISKKFRDFGISDFTNLKHFIRGYSPEGEIYSFQLNSVRSSQTINGYLAVYREFALFLDLDIKPLFSKSSHNSNINSIDNHYDGKQDRYKVNEHSPQAQNEIPWYISVDEILMKLFYTAGEKPFIDSVTNQDFKALNKATTEEVLLKVLNLSKEELSDDYLNWLEATSYFD